MAIWNRLRRPLRRRPAHLRLGDWGEDQAAKFLKRKGFKLLARNWRSGKKSEIDLVVRTAETLVFVEVKTRATEAFGPPAAAVDRAKRKALRRAANKYLARMRQPPTYYRFDVVEVIGTPKSSKPPEIRHTRRAFAIGARD